MFTLMVVFFLKCLVENYHIHRSVIKNRFVQWVFFLLIWNFEQSTCLDHVVSWKRSIKTQSWTMSWWYTIRHHQFDSTMYRIWSWKTSKFCTWSLFKSLWRKRLVENFTSIHLDRWYIVEIWMYSSTCPTFTIWTMSDSNSSRWFIRFSYSFRCSKNTDFNASTI